jgi:hypothetical protein
LILNKRNIGKDELNQSVISVDSEGKQLNKTARLRRRFHKKKQDSKNPSNVTVDRNLTKVLKYITPNE